MFYVANYNIRYPNDNLSNMSDNCQEECPKTLKSDVGCSKSP